MVGGTSWEREEGREEGKEKGREEGKEEGTDGGREERKEEGKEGGREEGRGRVLKQIWNHMEGLKLLLEPHTGFLPITASPLE